MVNKLNTQDSFEVEFHCEQSTKRVRGTAVNEYFVTVQSPGGFQIRARNFLFLVPLPFFTFKIICMLLLANTCLCLEFEKLICVAGAEWFGEIVLVNSITYLFLIIS